MGGTRGMRNEYEILAQKSEGKKPLVKPMYRSKDNIKMNLSKRDICTWTGFTCLNMTSDKLL
jgi:hypothetical protein